MKFRVNASDFAKVLGKIVGVVPAKSTLAILESLHFSLQKNALTITGTDLELAMSVTMEVEGMKNGQLCIPAKRVAEIVRVLPSGPVTIDGSAETRRVTVAWNLGQFRLACDPADEYPSLASLAGEGGAEIIFDPDALKGIIHRSLFAVSTDELRPSMMGVYFVWKGGALQSVATDGHRLVRVTTPGMPETMTTQIVVPSKALSLLARTLESGPVAASLGASAVRFSQGGVTISSRVIDEQYPNYESVIPLDNDRIARLPRRPLIDALKRVLLVSSSLTHQVRLKLSEGALQVSSEDVDAGHEGREDIACSYSGAEMAIGFNGTFVEDALSHLDGDEVEFAFSSPTRACIMRPGDAAQRELTLMLVMPVRINA
jgi:DNA polymerase-3 subunit beta